MKMTETIEIQDNANGNQWRPYVGEETDDLLRSKGFTNPDGTLNLSGQKILNEAFRVMDVCGNPNSSSNAETGIAIGYVQSGKTLSFTVLATLQEIIIIK